MVDKSKFTAALKSEYEQLFAAAVISPLRIAEAKGIVDKIYAQSRWSQYEVVSRATGVPPHVIGIIHSLEASLSFNGHLHNGDPLKAKTVHKPAGRPPVWTDKSTWADSAADALAYDGLDKWTDWSVAGLAFVLESYNGWGYRLSHPHVKSPYLWSFTSIYHKGKYRSDGKWSDTEVSDQCGGMALLKCMMEAGKIPQVSTAGLAEVGLGSTKKVFEPTAVRPPAVALPYPGTMLARGSTGPAVRQMQSRLLDLGYRGIGIVDGDFGARTEEAVRLFQARGMDHEAVALDIDGIVGPRTWFALFGAPPAPTTPGTVASPLLAAVIEIAKSQVGVREVPIGSNKGPEVSAYLGAVENGLDGVAWCMAFVYWCFVQAASQLGGVANPAPRTAGVLNSWERAQNGHIGRIVTAAAAQKDPSQVTPGMVFYISTGGGHGHTGIVVDVIDGRLITVEDNTNEGGSSEGIGVFMRNSRKIASINVGFIDFG